MARRRHDPYSYTAVRLPERDLAESILHFASPMLEALGPGPAIDDAHRAIKLAIDVWNAHIAASEVWGNPRLKALKELRKAMRETPEGAHMFELLGERWRKHSSLDPRMVEAWTYDRDELGAPRLVCQMVLPDGVRAEVPPPAEKRVAIGGVFLDETQIRLSPTAYLSFPVHQHRGVVSLDGTATIHTKMPTALQLFAQGRLSRIGGEPVEVSIGGKQLGPMVLAEVRCEGEWRDVAVLVFRPLRP